MLILTQILRIHTWVVVTPLVYALPACGKSDSPRERASAPPQPPAAVAIDASTVAFPTLDSFVAYARAHTRGDILDAVQMPPAERAEIQQLIAKDPEALLALPGVEVLLGTEATELAKFAGKIIVLPDLKHFDGFGALALKDWKGHYLFLGIHEIDPQVALGLALWSAGKGLHLDQLSTFDSEIARRLARFHGTVLGLGKARGSGDAYRELKAFKGYVAISL